jgi:hypothetical protein
MRDDHGVSTKAVKSGGGVADSSEQLYRNVYEAAPLAFVLWDCECRVTDWNKRAEVEEIVTSLKRGVLASHNINENLTKFGVVILCEWINTVRYDQNYGQLESRTRDRGKKAHRV